MKDPKKIVYNDNAQYAAEAYEDQYKYEILALPDAHHLENYSYKDYLINYQTIINSKMPYYSFQSKILNNIDFEDLRKRAIQRCNEISHLNNSIYLELITKIGLNPLQLYYYEDYENYYESYWSRAPKKERITKQKFCEVKKNLLDEMIKTNQYIPLMPEHAQLANVLMYRNHF